jgi:hypothetical protein
MFTWVCPQCGREVPPSYTECPDCKNAAANPPQPNQPPAPPPSAAPPQGPPQQQAYYPQPPQAPPPQGPQFYPPQHQPQPQHQQQYAPPQYGQAMPQYYPTPRREMKMPVWLMTILFAVGIGGAVFGIYTLMSTNRAQTGSGPAPTAAVESPAAKPGSKANPLQKYIEVAGVRFTTDAKKKTQATFLLINHSEADISGLAGNVTIWGRTKKSEEDAVGTFNFSTNLPPFGSKELTVPVNTKLKIYELPDWQNVTTDVQITAPGA